MTTQGIFVGLSTIDIIYNMDEFPARNKKAVAQSQEIVVGGPALNAAIAFSFLGGSTTLVTPVGQHTLGALMKEDCERYNLELIDLTPDSHETPPISSVWVDRQGQRSVVSVNASRTRIPLCDVLTTTLSKAQIVMVDGHAMSACVSWARAARLAGIKVVLDGGSWKPGTDELLGSIDTAICSNDFLPPGCSSEDEVSQYMRASGVKNIAITRGADPVRYASGSSTGIVEVPRVEAVDTTGAGDIFHGAFCFFVSTGYPFSGALREAARIASDSCRYPGTRKWMEKAGESR